MTDTRHQELYERLKGDGYDEERIQLLLDCFSIIEGNTIGADYLKVSEFKENI
jgi:hypothetical protein